MRDGRSSGVGIDSERACALMGCWDDDVDVDDLVFFLDYFAFRLRWRCLRKEWGGLCLRGSGTGDGWRMGRCGCGWCRGLNFRLSMNLSGASLLFGDSTRFGTFSCSCSLGSALRPFLHSLFSVSLLLGLRFSASDVTDAVFVRVATAIIFLAPISAFDQVRFAFLCLVLSFFFVYSSVIFCMFLWRCELYITVIATLPLPSFLSLLLLFNHFSHPALFDFHPYSSVSLLSFRRALLLNMPRSCSRCFFFRMRGSLMRCDGSDCVYYDYVVPGRRPADEPDRRFVAAVHGDLYE